MNNCFILHQLQVNSSPAVLESVRKLYYHSFPREERRDWNVWLKTLGQDTRFRVLYLSTESYPLAGFISLWDFATLVYGEHFAIQPELRNSGLGSQVLQVVAEQLGNRPLVIEVEPPYTEFAKRRIAFYKRNGFEIVQEEYLQPPYWEDSPQVPLFLMSNRDVSESVLSCAIRSIYQAVAHPSFFKK
jgi:ribosomal protein S18 acetylase RimI-like enzyme